MESKKHASHAIETCLQALIIILYNESIRQSVLVLP